MAHHLSATNSRKLNSPRIRTQKYQHGLVHREKFCIKIQNRQFLLMLPCEADSTDV